MKLDVLATLKSGGARLTKEFFVDIDITNQTVDCESLSNWIHDNMPLDSPIVTMKFINSGIEILRNVEGYDG